MLKKFTIEYGLHFRKHSPPEHHRYSSDDAVACEEFVLGLLEHGMGLHAIKRDGADLPKVEFDRMVRIAATGVASKLICRTLNIKVDEERYRFGFAA